MNLVVNRHRSHPGSGWRLTWAVSSIVGVHVIGICALKSLGENASTATSNPMT